MYARLNSHVQWCKERGQVVDFSLTHVWVGDGFALSTSVALRSDL